MCGITGWVDFKKRLVQEKQTINRMTDTLSKRGLMILTFGGAPCFIRT